MPRRTRGMFLYPKSRSGEGVLSAKIALPHASGRSVSFGVQLLTLGAECSTLLRSLAWRVFALYPIEGFFPIFQHAFKL